MNQTNSQAKNQVVLIGGGHTHALVLNDLKKQPLDGAHITVINPGTTAPYSGMLPGFVAGHYSRKELDIDLHALTQKVGAELIDGRAVAIDPDKKIITLEDDTSVSYHLASVDVGITSRMQSLQGFSEYAVPAKPLGTYSSRWDEFRSSTGLKNVVVIGGGIAGAELAMAMAFALRREAQTTTVTLLDRSTILSSNSAKTQKRVRKALEENNVKVMEGVNVTEVTSSGVNLANSATIDASFIVGAAGATPHAWLKDTGLTLVDGFIEVSNILQSSDPNIFAVGDCAHMSFDPRPKAGVYAVRQAPVLLNNIRKRLTNVELDAYSPQTDYLKLVSLGGKKAFGEKNGISLSGHLMWRLKNYIDRKFMNQF